MSSGDRGKYKLDFNSQGGMVTPIKGFQREERKRELLGGKDDKQMRGYCRNGKRCNIRRCTETCNFYRSNIKQLKSEHIAELQTHMITLRKEKRKARGKLKTRLTSAIAEYDLEIERLEGT